MTTLEYIEEAIRRAEDLCNQKMNQELSPENYFILKIAMAFLDNMIEAEIQFFEACDRMAGTLMQYKAMLSEPEQK